MKLKDIISPQKYKNFLDTHELKYRVLVGVAIVYLLIIHLNGSH
jgi:hypothetical protein